VAVPNVVIRGLASGEQLADQARPDLELCRVRKSVEYAMYGDGGHTFQVLHNDHLS
jgi:hypothetical protein